MEASAYISNDHTWRHLPIFLMPLSRYFSHYGSMDVQDQLVQAKFEDLDAAPKVGAGKEPDEFDVNPYKVREGLGYAAAFITCRHDPPSHTHILTAMQTDIINAGAVHASNHKHVPSHPFQSVYPFILRTRAMPRCGRNGINSTEISRPAGPGTPPLGAETTSMYAHTCGCITA